MAVYQVRLINPALELDHTIQVPDDQYILDIAEEAGIRLPSGCKQGECSACVTKLISGEVDQSEQKFLRSNEIQAGYVVSCVTYPLSDCTLETHQEQVLYKSALYYKPEAGKAE
ncbi:2Fe-2S iron-sulfur cluster-binding protein [aff. Roholtiella sp. LEGE 12411]|uniref:2Fe-2S iron-sulfur cluster-binding protein n=1 Tax=aff. Roholtiella sp. LEGE 12411 TaxID=1828822 RepID=UPI00187EF168|nr:2Fe-2S iron-sulfur cluster-binding protein [aff. Roholtiella sp. LEGE 12411]MBE9033827.1 2Fe-2S iron-sulfur cluster binding domain-containing protein [aff. Roholtiella sp. LEGE 12411]